MEIIPSVIGKDFSEVLGVINRVSSFVNWVQIDVSDGVFSESVTWPYNEGGSVDDLSSFLKTKTRPKVEMHLMISLSKDMIEKWISVSPDRIMVHYESTQNHKDIFSMIRDAGIECGLVLNVETPVGVVEDLLDHVSCVQFMSIDKIGFYGADFNVGVFDKIRELRKMSSGIKISVDGGVNLSNAKDILDAGADKLVVGSAILRSNDIGLAIKSFNELA